MNPESNQLVAAQQRIEQAEAELAEAKKQLAAALKPKPDQPEVGFSILFEDAAGRARIIRRSSTVKDGYRYGARDLTWEQVLDLIPTWHLARVIDTSFTCGVALVVKP